MQGSNFQGGGASGFQGVSSAQVTGAQFSAARSDTGRYATGGGSGYGVFSEPVRQVPLTPAYPHEYVYRNGTGFGTETHGSREAPFENPSTGGVSGRAGFNSSAPFTPVLAAPVVLDPNPALSVGHPAVAGSPQIAAVVSPQIIHPGTPAPAFNGGAATANSALTRANQWRHDPGHPHHHRHFVYLNDSIYLIDEGVFDEPPDFSVSSDVDSYTYEDGYYDTFDSSTVGAVQTRLGNEGYYNGVIDSKMKPDVRDAIAKYQQEHGLPVSGVIDEPLLKELGLL